MLPSEFIPNKDKYPIVHRFVSELVDMQMNDVRTMLMLPKADLGLDAGCNFAAVAVLLNIISGISTKIFNSCEKMASGDRFKELLLNYYPWETTLSDDDKANQIDTFYEYLRNPLSHNLGWNSHNKKNKVIVLNKPSQSLTKSQVESLDQEIIGENWKQSPSIEETTNAIIINIVNMYCGVRVMLLNIFSDENQMTNAERKFKGITQ